MKATELIKYLEKIIKKRGDVDVYVESPGFNCEDVYSTQKGVGEYVHVENLKDYPEEMIFEHHGENTGLIWAAVIAGDEHIDHCG